MKSNILTICLFVSLINIYLSSHVYGKEKKVLKIAVGLAIPPLVIPDEKNSNSGSGIEYDTVQEIFKLKNMEILPVYVPFGRVRALLKNHEVDGAMTVMDDGDYKGVYFSDSHLDVLNVVVTLRKNKLKISKISDLTKRTIVGFQDAKVYLGKEYASAVAKSKDYTELSDQYRQVKLLYSNRVESIVISEKIFLYYRKMIKTKEPEFANKYVLDQDIDVHRIFKTLNYTVGFTNQNIRNQFNNGLQQLKSSGQHTQIIDKYTK